MAKQVGYLRRGLRRRREPHHCSGGNTTPTTQSPLRLLHTGHGLAFFGFGVFAIRRRASIYLPALQRPHLSVERFVAILTCLHSSRSRYDASVPLARVIEITRRTGPSRSLYSRITCADFPLLVFVLRFVVFFIAAPPYVVVDCL